MVNSSSGPSSTDSIGALQDEIRLALQTIKLRSDQEQGYDDDHNNRTVQ